MSILDCFGQQRAIKRLQQARLAGRTPHSLIFYGPDGIGKTLMARQWAKLLLCKNPIRKPWNLEENAPSKNAVTIHEIEDCCDICPECRLADADTHPDLHRIRRELVVHTRQGRNRQPIDLPIDVIREFLIEPSVVYPTRAQASVFIVEDAHTMTRAAQNSLLKTLEEPPLNTYIILICVSPDQLLPTIRSRCQSIRFDPLPELFIRQKLTHTNIQPEQAEYAADFAEGSLGLALQMSALGIYPVACEMISQLSAIDYKTALSFGQWLTQQSQDLAKTYQKAYPDAGDSSAGRTAQRLILQMLSHIFRSAIRLATDGQIRFSLPANHQRAMEKIASDFGDYGCAEAIRAIHKAQQHLESNVNAALIFESLVLNCVECALRGEKVPKI